MSFVLREIVKGAAILTLNDPGRRNILSRELCASLIDAIGAAEDNPAVRMIVIAAHGKAFCAGADLEDLKAASAGDTEAVEGVYQAFMRVANSTLPTLAEVDGAAVGAGINLALACDMRLCGDSAMFDTRFLSIGLHPGGGHAWMLLRAVGWQHATRMLLCGDRVDGAEAKAIGLSLDTLPAAELRARSLALAARMQTAPREVLARTKMSMRFAGVQSHAEAFAHETSEQMWSLHQPAFDDLITSLKQRIGSANR